MNFTGGSDKRGYVADSGTSVVECDDPRTPDGEGQCTDGGDGYHRYCKATGVEYGYAYCTCSNPGCCQGRRTNDRRV